MELFRTTIVGVVEFYLGIFPNNEALKDLLLDARAEDLQDYDGEAQPAIDDYDRLAHNLAYPETLEQEDLINWSEFM